MAGKLPYDSMNDSLKSIATKLDATLPVKKYSNIKDEIAGTLDAIADADIGGGGGGGSDYMVVHFTYEYVENGGWSYYKLVCDKTYAEIKAYADAGGAVIATIIPTPDGTGASVTATATLANANVTYSSKPALFFVWFDFGFGQGGITCNPYVFLLMNDESAEVHNS